MKKNNVLFYTLIFISILCKSQDTIIKTNGEKIAAKVMVIEIETIIYKKSNNINGPTYNILKSDVYMVKYENGTTDLFNTAKPEPQEKNNLKKLSQNDIILRDGNNYKYQGRDLRKREVGNILSVNSPKQYHSYISGYGCSIAAVTIAGIGSLCTCIGIFTYRKSPTMLIIGGSIIVVSIPFGIAGVSIMKHSVDAYNRSITSSINTKLNLGFTQNGVGFTLMF